MNRDQLGSIMKLQRMKFIDKMFNVGKTEEGEEFEGINFSLYHDEVENLLENVNRKQTEIKSMTNND